MPVGQDSQAIQHGEMSQLRSSARKNHKKSMLWPNMLTSFMQMANLLNTHFTEMTWITVSLKISSTVSRKIGRASCRERGSNSVVGGGLLNESQDVWDNHCVWIDLVRADL